jgi:murein DD-endopeptidase MepM/ murein hydrolase activator NlpD
LKRSSIVTILLLIFIGLLLTPCFADLIQDDKERWKPFYIEVAPAQTVLKWQLPFKTEDRSDLATIKIISVFGAPRLSYLKGHIHTGADMIPGEITTPHTYIYPMGPGVVCSIHLTDPHRTVVIKHRLSNGETLYTSYKHLQDVYVPLGQQVTPETPLGRLYTKTEAKVLGGNYNHLHLEIRRSFDDYGVASWATMQREALDQRFIDPQIFMKENIRPSASK